jgi:predicted dithiol-disulfide oxidoreductase (DUF899 family)
MPSVAVRRCAPGASDEYIKARESLFEEEWKLRNQIEAVAAQRRALPSGPVLPDYHFKEGPSNINDTTGTIQTTSLADLAADGRSVVIYHMMFAKTEPEPCGMCSLVVDSLNGIAKHISQNANFAVIAAAPIEKLRAYAAKRGWNEIRLLSAHGTNFNKDLNFEEEAKDGFSGQQAGISVFRKDGDGNVRHMYSMSPKFDTTTERGLDMYTPLWNILDLIPEGRGNFLATNDYIFE